MSNPWLSSLRSIALVSIPRLSVGVAGRALLAAYWASDSLEIQ